MGCICAAIGRPKRLKDLRPIPRPAKRLADGIGTLNQLDCSSPLLERDERRGAKPNGVGEVTKLTEEDRAHRRRGEFLVFRSLPP